MNRRGILVYGTKERGMGLLLEARGGKCDLLSLKEVLVWSWTKVGLGVAKKEYLTYVKGDTLNSGAELELQTSEERKR